METTLDRFIGHFSPSWQRRRLEDRIVVDYLKRNYQGASSNRFNSGWQKTPKDENKVISTALPALRSRSFDLVKNDGYAKRGLCLLLSNIIGTGIQTEFDDKRIQKQWQLFSGSKLASFDERFNYFGLQYMALNTALLLGDCIIRKRRVTPTENFPFSFKVQLLPPQFLDHSYSVNKDNSIIKGGIEFDRDGKRKAYHLFTSDPLEGSGVRDRISIPASEIEIFSIDNFLGQLRGVPELANCMTTIKDVQEYEEGELKKQKAHAFITGFITGGERSLALAEAQITKKNENTETIEMGMMKRLEDGESVHFPDPPELAHYPEHIKQALFKISSSLGVPYCLLTGDFSSMNYSSFRGQWLAFHKEIDVLRNLYIIPRFCDVVADWFLDDLANLGQRTKNRGRYYSCPRRELIDPTKEVPSIILGMRAGIESYGDVLKSLGRNPEETLQDIAYYNKMIDDLQLVLTSDARQHEKGGVTDLKNEKKENIDVDEDL